jgi:hypothetical protein
MSELAELTLTRAADSAAEMRDRRLLAQAETTNDEAQRREQSAHDDFMRYAIAGDMLAPAHFAPMVRNYASRWPQAKRLPTVGEVMLESLDYTDGPQHDDVFTLLVKAARGQQVQAEAKALIERMAGKWAYMHGADKGSAP